MKKKQHFHREEVKIILRRVLQEGGEFAWRARVDRHRQIAKEHERSNPTKSRAHYVLAAMASGGHQSKEYQAKRDEFEKKGIL